jgi:hypothetical protein
MRRHSDALAWLGFAVVAQILAVLYVHAEAKVYAFDEVAFWSRTLALRELFLSHPGAGVAELWRSIRQEDYTLVGAVPLVPVLAVAGDSRLAFILALVNVYALPAAWLCARLGRDLGLPGWGVLAWLALSPQWWGSTWAGYVDVGGLLFLVALFRRSAISSADQWGWREILEVGLVAFGAVLFRRWFAYPVITWLLLVPLVDGLRCPPERRWRAMAAPALASLLAAVLFFLVAGPSAWRMALTDHRELYSAYRWVTSPREALTTIAGRFGALTACLAAVGLAALWKKPGTRRFALLLGLHAVLSVVWFSRTQELDLNHVLMLVPGAALAIVAVPGALVAQSSRAGLGALAAAGVLWLGAANLWQAVHNDTWAELHAFPPLLSDTLLAPRTRPDLDTIQRMLQELQTRVTPGGQLYVLSSSATLSAGMLRMAHLTWPERFPRELTWISHTFDVDKRDGFPWQFLQATHVLVASPLQLHLRPEDQQIVGRLWTWVQAPGSPFRPLGEPYALEDGVSAQLFERVGEVSPQTLAPVLEALQAAYPEHASRFRPILQPR